MRASIPNSLLEVTIVSDVDVALVFLLLVSNGFAVNAWQGSFEPSKRL